MPMDMDVLMMKGRNVEMLLEWAKEAVERGAGELLVTSIDRHGTGIGFDIELYQALAEVVDVPVTAFGGAGNVQHFCGFIYKNECNRCPCWRIVTQ